MSDRRPLIEGLKPKTPPVDPAVEKQFVYGSRRPRDVELSVEQLTSGARARITTRIRADFAAALKRASLERQLNGTTPNTLQEILEEAIEPWLRLHGYVK
jgi:hypothetical protein